MYCDTGPIGTITNLSYTSLSADVFDLLRDEGPWDGVRSLVYWGPGAG